MRMYCCGKAVTGIGNVPRWDPPVRDKSLLVKADEADEEDGGDAVAT